MKASAILMANPNFEVRVDADNNVLDMLGKVWDSSVPSSDGFTFDATASIRAFREFGRTCPVGSELLHLSDLAYNREQDRLMQVVPDYVGAVFNGLVEVRPTAEGMTVWFGMKVSGPTAEYYDATLNGYPGATLVCRYVHGNDRIEVDEEDNVRLSGADPKRRVITKVCGADLVVYRRTMQTTQAVSDETVTNPITVRPGILPAGSAIDQLHTNVVYSRDSFPDIDTQSGFILKHILDEVVVHERNRSEGLEVPSHLTIVTTPVVADIICRALNKNEQRRIRESYQIAIIQSISDKVTILFGDHHEISNIVQIYEMESIMSLSMWGSNLRAV
jgi:hypothetical protein